MDDRDVGRMWNDNADAWTTLARAGYDVYRDHINTPAFMAMLPPVTGLRGLDIGCGEGHNTRLVAKRGAKMTAVDVAPKFVAYARRAEHDDPLGVAYVAASGGALPFARASFDFAVAFMSLQDMASQDQAIAETHRVLKPGGFFQFSILHPCFATARQAWIRDESGEKVAVACAGYFDDQVARVDEWIFSSAPPEVSAKFPKFRVPRFFKTLGDWINLLLDTGFVLERLGEPYADDETAKRHPEVADSRIVGYYLHVRCRKPA